MKPDIQALNISINHRNTRNTRNILNDININDI